MRSLFMLLLCAILSISANAQFTETTNKGGGFDVSSGVSTGQSITIEGKQYPTFVTESGSTYIICNSPKTGNDYPVWIGTYTGEMFQGHKVYQMKSGKYCYYKISENSGNPYAKYLTKE